MIKRHTVLLGAGATMAAIPNGDKNGKKSSVMNNLFSELGMNYILKNVHLHTSSKNLEDIYSELASRPECKDVVQVIEKSLYDYFASLELPDSPTVYDYLILSLTGKDVIATFNWDPLLIQAYKRCHSYRFSTNLPHILCLHGNTDIGYCEKDVEYGACDAECPKCHKPFVPTRLLYPVKEKNYSNDPFIRKSWEAVDAALNESFMFTVFGYSAPSSDAAAVSLLKKAWGNLDDRSFEEFSVIDLMDSEEVYQRWKNFIYKSHYTVTNNFFDSYLGKFPRRSCECFFAMKMLNIPMYGNKGFHPDMTWYDIDDFIYSLTMEEICSSDENYPLHYSPMK